MRKAVIGIATAIAFAIGSYTSANVLNPQIAQAFCDDEQCSSSDQANRFGPGGFRQHDDDDGAHLRRNNNCCNNGSLNNAVYGLPYWGYSYLGPVVYPGLVGYYLPGPVAWYPGPVGSCCTYYYNPPVAQPQCCTYNILVQQFVYYRPFYQQQLFQPLVVYNPTGPHNCGNGIPPLPLYVCD